MPSLVCNAQRSVAMNRRTIIIVSVVFVALLLIIAHSLNLAALLGGLNPHALP